MKSYKKFFIYSLILYFFIFFTVGSGFALISGSDLVGGTFSYFGLISISTVLLYLFDSKEK